ncbi:hypothetical protein ATANTOWER_028734, partial [Ataeniobius toweri]|nr:hypothetical protein [Ataeniobius toweri]
MENDIGSRLVAFGVEGSGDEEAQAKEGEEQHWVTQGRSVGSRWGTSFSVCCVPQCSGGQSLITALGSRRRT